MMDLKPGKHSDDTSANKSACDLPVMQTPPEQPGMTDTMMADLHGYIDIMCRRRKSVLATIVAVFVLGMLYTMTRTPVYQSVAKIVVVTSAPGGTVSGDGSQMINDLRALTRSRSIDTQVEIISSSDVLSQAFGKLDHATQAKGFGRKGLPGWACSVAGKKDTDIIVVTTRAYDPKAAADLANSVADTYFERDLEKNSRATSQARTYAEGQMAVIERKLAKASKDLAAYKQESGLIEIDTQLAEAAKRSAGLQLDLDAARTGLAAGQSELASLERQIAGEEPDVVTSSTIAENPLFRQALTRIDGLQSQRAEMLQEYTTQSKEVRALDERIKDEEGRLKKVAGTVVEASTKARNPIRDGLIREYADGLASNAALSARTRALTGSIRSLDARLATLPEQERKLTELTQNAELLKGTYDMLSQRYYALLLSERSILPNGQLISRAMPNPVPAYPNTKRSLVLYLTLGVLLAIGTAVTVERLDVRVREQETVEQMVKSPILALVPRIPEEKPRILSDERNDFALLESFRILRSNIWFSAIDRRISSLVVTSPNPSEGKSTVSANLAIAMAMDGKRVMLLDGDMRRPSLHGLFGVTRELGFSSVVTAACSIEDAIVHTHIPNLDFMPSGPTPPNPPEVLNSQHSRRLVEDLKDRYDVVILDCPPCIGLSEVQVASTLADGVLLVVSMNETLKPQLQIAAKVLSRVRAPLMGVVLNKVEFRRPGYGYSGGYYKYHHNYKYFEEVEAEEDCSGNGAKKSVSAARS